MSLIDLFHQVSILLSLPAVVLAGISAALIVIVRDWRVDLFAYAVLSVMLALLLSQTIPTEWALIQAIVGGLISVMIFMSGRQLRGMQHPGANRDAQWPQLASLTSLRLIVVLFAAAVFFLVRDRIQLPEVDALFKDAIVWLVLIGLVGLALHEEPLHAGLSLLIILGGFLLLLFQLTQRRMMIGLMEAWQLLLGLAVSYLTVSRGLAGTAVSPARDAGWWR